MTFAESNLSGPLYIGKRPQPIKDLGLTRRQLANLPIAEIRRLRQADTKDQKPKL